MKKIDIKGPIIPNNHQWVYDWLDLEATSPKKVIAALEDANGEEVEVHINSGGGSVFDGSEIYTAIKDYQGKTTGKIVGLAGSAASVTAMAPDKLMMSPTAQIMIHNAATRADGDYRDMEHTAGILRNANKTAANSYMAKSGMTEKELLDMMDKETWLTPQQAMEYKLIDEIMFEQDYQFVASVDSSGLLPQQVIDKLRNEVLQHKTNEQQQSSHDNDESEEDFYMHNLRKKKLELLNKEVI